MPASFFRVKNRILSPTWNGNPINTAVFSMAIVPAQVIRGFRVVPQLSTDPDDNEIPGAVTRLTVILDIAEGFVEGAVSRKVAAFIPLGFLSTLEEQRIVKLYGDVELLVNEVLHATDVVERSFKDYNDNQWNDPWT